MNKERLLRIADRVVEYSIYGLIFYIPISIAAIEIFSVAAILFFIIKKIIRPDFSFIRDNKAIYLFLGLFVLFMGLSLFNSGPYLEKSLRAFFSKWFQYILVALAAADTLKNRKRIRNALAVLVFSSALTALSGLSQYFFGIEFLRGREPGQFRGSLAITSAFNHYNNFAAYLALIIPIAMALSLMRVKNKIYKKGPLFLLALLTITLAFTFSRGGWLGFLAGAGLFVFLLGKYKIGLAVIGGFFGMLFFLPQLRERFLFTFSKSGDAGRFAIWQGAWEMIKENPILGKGLGTFMDYFPQYTSGLGIQYSHNCFLQIWAEAGVFSLLSFLIFVGLLLYSGIKKARSLSTYNLSILSIGISCGIFGFIVHSFFDNQLYSVQLRALFWLMGGVLLAISNLVRVTDKRYEGPKNTN